MDTSTILEYLRLTSHYIALLARLLTYPLRLLWIPVSYLLSALRVVLFPVIYLVSYVVGWCRSVFDFIAALQPLYTFLSTAALVGALAGLTLATSSTVITSYLGMQGGDAIKARASRSRSKDSLSAYSETDAGLVKDESSSNEGEEWYWPDPSPSRRRPATGLLSQTILEEEDDSDV